MKRLSVNMEIILTHLLTRRRQTIIAALGVAVGMGLYIIMAAIVNGTNAWSDSLAFKSCPHIRVYDEDKISHPIDFEYNNKSIPIIVNPKITNRTKKIINPAKLIESIKQMDDIVLVVPSVKVSLFYGNGKSQIDGIASGMNIMPANSMFDIQSNMLEGKLSDLSDAKDGIIIGVGIAQKLNLRINDNLSVKSSFGVDKQLKVVGIFKTGVVAIDNGSSYINPAAAQQLMKETPGYVTDIYVNIRNFEKAKETAARIERLTGYKAEDWESANQQSAAARSTRSMIFIVISWAVVMVAAFGIYNIMNMTVSQKINDIAILKATGFSSKDVSKIFVGESLLMGITGSIAAFLLAILVVNLLSLIYLGGSIGYFPVKYEKSMGIEGIIIGMIMAFAAGYFPARNAAKTDPIEIFRGSYGK